MEIKEKKRRPRLRVIPASVRDALLEKYPVRHRSEFDELIRIFDRYLRSTKSNSKKATFSYKYVNEVLAPNVRIDPGKKHDIARELLKHFHKEDAATYFSGDGGNKRDESGYRPFRKRVSSVVIWHDGNYRDNMLHEIAYRCSYSDYFNDRLKENPELKELIETAMSIKLLRTRKPIEDIDPGEPETLNGFVFTSLELEEMLDDVFRQIRPYFLPTEDEDKELKRPEKVKKDLKASHKSRAVLYNIRGLSPWYSYIAEGQPGNRPTFEESVSSHLNLEKMKEDGIDKFNDSWLFKRDYKHHQDHWYEDLDQADLPPGFTPNREPGPYSILLSHILPDFLSPTSGFKDPSRRHDSACSIELSSVQEYEMSSSLSEGGLFGLGKGEEAREGASGPSKRVTKLLESGRGIMRGIPPELEGFKSGGMVTVFEVEDQLTPEERYLFHVYRNRFFDHAQEELIPALASLMKPDFVTREIYGDVEEKKDQAGEGQDDGVEPEGVIPEEVKVETEETMTQDSYPRGDLPYEDIPYADLEDEFTEDEFEPTDEELRQMALDEEAKDPKAARAIEQVEAFRADQKERLGRIAQSKVGTEDDVNVILGFLDEL